MTHRGQTALSFTFPTSLVQLQVVSSPESAKEKLMAQAYVEDVKLSSSAYRVQIQKGKYCYLKCSCKGCGASLRYRVDQHNQWKLTKARCRHLHQLRTSKNYQFRAVLDYMQSIPPGVPSSTLKKVICADFGINEKQFYYLLAKRRDQPIKIPQLIAYLEQNGYQIHLSGQERPQWQPPELLLASHRDMKRLFEKYGDAVSFDLTFKLIKDVHPSNKQWKVGCFLGTSSAKRIVPLMIVVTLQDQKQTYVQILRTFFRTVGIPNVLITDEQRAIHAAVVQLQAKNEWKGLHLYDSYHILHNARKKLTKKESIVFFARLLHSKNLGEYHRRVGQAKDNLLPQDQPVLDSFLRNDSFYCFSKIKPTFFGFSSSSSPNQAFHNLLKKYQSSEKQFTLAVRNIVTCAGHLLSQCHKFQIDQTPYQRIFGLPELKIMRNILTKKILAKVMQEIAQSMKVEAVNVRSQEIIVREHRTHFKLQLTDELWRCSCYYSQKTQLPCRHVLRVLISKNINLLDYLPDRWIFKAETVTQVKQKKSVRLGRQRATRRKIVG